MKSFPQFNKQQIELLIVASFYLSNRLANGDNLAKTIVEVDYCFNEMFAFDNSLDKKSLTDNPFEYATSLFQPIYQKLYAHHEALMS